MPKASRVHPLPFSCLPERIRGMVDLTSVPGCWLWIGYVDCNNVPKVSYEGFSRAARRVIYEFLTNVPLARTEPVAPKCGQKLCMNPEHQHIGNLRNLLPSTTPQFGQARHICSLFGGENEMAKLLNLNPSTCYRWSYPPPNGTGGLIPHNHVADIKSMARFRGVLLTESDWDPAPFLTSSRKGK